MKKGRGELNRIFRLGTILVIACLLPQAIFAESSYNSELLTPTPDNGPYLSTHSTRFLGRRHWTIGTMLDMAHRPVELAGPAGNRVSGIVEDLLMLHLLGAFGFSDWFQVGVDVPIALIDRTVDVATGDISLHAKMSDVHLEGKFRLLDPDNPKYKGWGIAAIPFVDLPTGSGARLVGNKSFAGGAKIALESPNIKNLVRIALNLGFQMRESTDLFGTEVDDWFLYSLAANFRLSDRFEFVPEAMGKTVTGDFFQRESQSPLELAGLFRVLFLNGKMSLDVGGGAGLLSGVGAPAWRGIVRVAYRPLRRSLQAQVWEVPRIWGLTPEEYYLLSKECPPPEEFDPAKHNEDCEKIYELRELYRKCPPPEEFNAEIHDQACEKVYVLQGYDHDGDGVADFIDWCPDEEGPIENDGCPTYGMAYVDWEEGRVRSDKILFAFNSARLTPESRAIVNRIAEALRPKISDIKHLYVEGHTDNVGRLGYNKVLSTRRARAVRRLLQQYGIPGNKLRAIGYGESRPAVSNQTEEGRHQNRRVEIRFDSNR